LAYLVNVKSLNVNVTDV